MNVHDLESEFIFEDNVQTNLVTILNRYGKEFMVKYRDIIYPVIMSKFIINTNGLTGYRLYYNVSKPHSYLKPFEIFFIDPLQKKLNNNSYISNIQRTDEISGTAMVTFVLELQKRLGVEKTYLHDAATIICDDREMDLSLIKILERGEGFYSKLGFDYEPISSIGQIGQLGLNFNSEEELKLEIEKTIGEIRNLRIGPIINEAVGILKLILNVIQSQKYEDFEVEYFKTEPFIIPVQTYHAENPYLEIKKIIEDCRLTIDILSLSNTDILYKFLIDLFNDPNRCHYFPTILNILMKEHPRYRVSFGSVTYTRNYTILFTKLSHLRHSFIMVYDFAKHSKKNVSYSKFIAPEHKSHKNRKFIKEKKDQSD